MDAATLGRFWIGGKNRLDEKCDERGWRTALRYLTSQVSPACRSLLRSPEPRLAITSLIC
jgi:hypothetical protein